MITLARATTLLLNLALLAPLGAGQASSYALRFFGTGMNQQDRVRIGIDDDMAGNGSTPADVGAGSFTVEFWLRGELADNATGNAGGDVELASNAWIDGNIVVDRDIFGGSARSYGISLNGGLVRFGTGSADGGGSPDQQNTIEGSINVLDGAWHHVACVRDATTGIKRIWVDAVLDFPSSAGASVSDLSYPDAGVPTQVTPWGPYLVLAAEKHDAGPAFPSYAGYLDEVRLWSTARTGAELAQTFDRVLPAGTPGLVAAWRLEEGLGQTVTDSSGAGSPAGELIAGLSGNGEWVSRLVDPANTAPVTNDAAAAPSTLVLDTVPSGIPVTFDGVAFATPAIVDVVAGSAHTVEAPPFATMGGGAVGWTCWTHGGARAQTVVAPPGGRNLTADYHPASQAVVTATIDGAARNADWYGPVGQAPANLYDGGGLCWGRDGGGVYQTGLEYVLAVPQGATILTANLTFSPAGDQAATPATAIRAYDVADAPAFTFGAAASLTNHAPLLPAIISWTPPPFAPGTAATSPDLAPLVQAVVNRADWATGNHVGLVLDGAPASANSWRCVANFAAGAPPVLTVAWDTGGGTTPTCVDYGWTSYGLGLAPANALGLVGIGEPSPGATIQLAATGLGAAPFAWIAVSLGAASVPAFGGVGLIDAPGLLHVEVAPAALGSATWTVPLLASPSLVGFAVSLQAAALDPAQPAGVALSGGLRLRVAP